MSDLTSFDQFKIREAPKKGRGRSKQLASMSEKEKEEERKFIRAKNKIAARETRKKRKAELEELREKVSFYENNLNKKQRIEDVQLELNKTKLDLITTKQLNINLQNKYNRVNLLLKDSNELVLKLNQIIENNETQIGTLKILLDIFKSN